MASLTELVLVPLADAFMEVGVFVALLAAPFGWARYRWGSRLDALLERHRRLGPPVAAALTMPPGCGGAIVVMAVYARGAVSYGAAVAALVATMGDASWVLLAADPLLTLQLKVLLLVVGAGTGYAVDALGIAPRTRARTRAGTRATSRPRPAPAPPPVALTLPRPALVHGWTALPLLLWATLGVGATLSVPVTFQLAEAADAYLLVGLLGTGLCLVAFVRGGMRLADDDADDVAPRSLGQALRHGGQEVAFVTTWVAAAYLAWALVSGVTGFDGSQLPVLGLTGVVVGALVGLIPGCAVQIVFAGLFVAGGVPLPTLLANTISQDGDALLPLLALEHRSALVATVLTTVPALVVGSALLLLT